MELNNTTNYRLIEGQEKQSLLDKYINQLSDIDERTAGIEVYQISASLSLKEERKTEENQNFFSNFIKNNFTSKAPAYTNNQDNISSLSSLISKNKTSKNNQVSYQTRNSRDLSKANLAKAIRAM
ncbi:MAG: hypothetical protein HOA17_07260 [Candidatus Melainabacteria bacterium]|jgi:hypothetical protein|nr:hypothetical protein [Candidatus Melainabacteria bacterium]